MAVRSGSTKRKAGRSETAADTVAVGAAGAGATVTSECMPGTYATAHGPMVFWTVTQ